MKTFLSFIISALIITKAFGQYGAPTTIQTPTGVTVSATLETEFSPSEIQAFNTLWDDFLLKYHTVLHNAQRVSDVSALYNCHSYAWHVSDGGNKVWVGNPELYYIGSSPSYVIASNNIGRSKKVKYSSENHSAITTDTVGLVKSKWGTGPIILHDVNIFPYIVNDSIINIPPSQTVIYYQIPMSSPTSVSKGTAIPVSTTLNISNASYSWSGDGNYVCAAGSSMNGSVTGLNITSSNQGKAYVSIHSPYSNTTVKGIAYLNVSSQPSSPIISGPTLVCASGGSFSLNYIPTGNTVTWSSSSNLHTNNVHANPCTFTSTANGSDYVAATLSTPCSNNIIPVTQYPVWSGAPVFSSISGPYSTPNHHEASFYVVPDSKEAITSYTWNLNPLNGNSLFPSGSSLIIAFYNTGNYQLLVSAHNICGTGPIFWRGVNVYASNSLMISPNPASTTVNVSIVKDNTIMDSDSTSSLAEAAISDDQTKYTVSIFNSFGTQFLSIQKNSNPFSLQVDNLQNGIYIVVVSDGKYEYSRQLVVKH
jgi:hypothetical protein